MMRAMKIPTILRALAFVTAALLASAPSLHAQQNWRWANSLPASIQWKGVAYGNGLYVAVGLDATIATSPDAITWTIRRMSTANLTLNGIAHANGLFVAAGMGTPDSIGGGLIMTSTDGISWTINTTVAATYSAQFLSVVYGGGTWVVGGSFSGRVLTSTDGLNWTPRTIPSGVIAGTGTYGGGLFVLSGNGNTVITSPDGITWTRVAVAGVFGASTPYLPDVTYGAGKFVAVGRDSNFVGVAYTSTDATTWTQAPTIANASGNTGFLSVVNNGTTFVASGGVGVFSSPDGTTWTKQTSALPNSARQLGPQAENVSAGAFANGQFFVLGTYGSITTSTDGTTWTRRSTGTVNDLFGVIHDGTKFVAAGSGGTILTSTNGSTWTQVTTGTTSNFGRIAYNGTRYATADYSGILHSANLTSWTAVSGTGSERYYGVAYGGNTFVAAYDATSLGVRTSADGATWSARVGISGGGGNTVGLAFGNGTFVIAMSGFGSTAPKIFSSTDGATWTDRTPAGMTASPESLAVGSGRFVVLNGNRQSITSTDGANWTINTLPSSPSLSGVQFAGTQFIARSADYGASSYTSTDGVTWTFLADSTAPNNLLTGLAVSGTTVVGIANSGTILLGDLAAPPAAVVPAISGQPAAQTVVAGGSVTFTVTASGALTYQWKRNGTALLGATNASLTLTNVQAANAGSYTVDVTNATGTTTSAAATLTVTPAPSPGRLVNLSVRARVGPGEDNLIIGFVLGGSGTTGNKAVLVRAAGPSLAGYGVTGVLADPQINIVIPGAGTPVANNDDWAGDAQIASAGASVGAFPFTGAGSKDAAIHQAAIVPQVYSAVVSGVGATSGVAIAEIYDATPDAQVNAATPRLLNISGRARVGTGENVIIAGFVVVGTTSRTVLIRGVGPHLSGQGVTGALADPKLDLYQRGTAAPIASNDDWGSTNGTQLATAATQVGAATLAAGSKDSALLATLQPGVYSAIVSGVGGTSGVALVEVYEVP
jgi:hypothetical protein